MVRLDRIVGFVTDPKIDEALHRISHHGRIENLRLSSADMKRHRMRARTDMGTECAIALPRDQNLGNGAVLHLDHDRAIVVRMTEQPVILVRPRDAAAALELGYLAGNMHWHVSFRNDVLAIAQEGAAEAYLARLSPLLANGRVARVDDAG
jgi:urease accessory protein